MSAWGVEVGRPHSGLVVNSRMLTCAGTATVTQRHPPSPPCCTHVTHIASDCNIATCCCECTGRGSGEAALGPSRQLTQVDMRRHRYCHATPSSRPTVLHPRHTYWPATWRHAAVSARGLEVGRPHSGLVVNSRRSTCAGTATVAQRHPPGPPCCTHVTHIGLQHGDMLL